MPRGRNFKDGGGSGADRHAWAPPVDPFSSGATTDGLADWDVRSEELAAMILGYLANGQAVMFGVSRDGNMVSVGINVGEGQWRRKHARDAGELIGIVHEAVLALRGREAGLRVVGD